MIVKSLAKAISVLDHMARERRPLGVTEIGAALDIPKSSVSNILATFQQAGIVERDPDTGRFRLGIRLFELGNIVRSGLKLREIAIPYMRELVEKFGETVHLTTLIDGEVIYIESAQPEDRIVTAPVTGRRAHLHCTGVGKAILAHLPPSAVDAIIEAKGLPAFTSNTITDRKILSKELERTRRRGYAIDNMEHEHGIRCVAAPIFNEQGRVIGSMSITGPSPRFTETDIQEFAKAMQVATQNISKKLGGSPS